MKKPKRTSSKHWASRIKRVDGFGSGLEAEVAARLDASGAHYEYGRSRKKGSGISYRLESEQEYFPDFRLTNGIIIEAKGYFKKDMRDKHLAIRNQHPELDIRFVFSRSKDRIKGSNGRSLKMTCASWCETHGFKYADKLVPLEWINEKKT